MGQGVILKKPVALMSSTPARARSTTVSPRRSRAAQSTTSRRVLGKQSLLAEAMEPVKLRGRHAPGSRKGKWAKERKIDHEKSSIGMLNKVVPDFYRHFVAGWVLGRKGGTLEQAHADWVSQLPKEIMDIAGGEA